jgi:hypothetical protein
MVVVSAVIVFKYGLGESGEDVKDGSGEDEDGETGEGLEDFISFPSTAPSP